MTAQAPEGTRIDLPVEGMTCAACVRRVDRAVTKLDGVSRAEVSLAASVASITYDPALVSPDEIAERIEAMGYEVPEVVDFEGERRRAARRAVIGMTVAVAVMALGMGVGMEHTWVRWTVAALATVSVWGVGLGFHQGAISALRDRSLGMDALVSLGSATAWTWSTLVLVGLVEGDLHYGEAAMIVGIILLGEWLELRAKGQARASIEALASLAAPEAVLVDGRTIPSAELSEGDRFVVRSGDAVPADGTVVEGRASVDTAMLTGEPIPVDAGEGAELAAGTVVTSGRVVVEATRVGADTAVAQIGRLVARAQASHAPIQRVADRVAGIFVPIILVIAALTLTGWLATGHSLSDAVGPMVAVLVIACPCAMGLATPMAIMVGTGRGASLGVLIRDGSVLERAKDIRRVVLDKTGTLTEGRLTVAEVHPADGVEDADLRRLAGAAAAASTHPVSVAIATAFAPDAAGSETDDVVETPGVGVEATVDGVRVTVGRPEAEVIGVASATVAEIRGDGRVLGWIGLADGLKLTSATAVRHFVDLGITPELLSGDRPEAARAVAAEVGITDVQGGLLPGDKEAIIGRHVDGGEAVAMVGDGSNDAPALARATLGVAMGAGTDVARNASDITLVADDLLAAVDAIRLARRTFTTIQGNLFWAFAYNVAAIPLAALGYLNPAVAAGAMSFSSIFVVGNSLRLRRFRSVRS